MEKYNFIYNEDIDFKLIQARETIYLDLNVWIDLADAKTPPAKLLKEILKLLVDEKKIFCPLHFSTISEMRKAKFDSVSKLGKIMDQLSLNFTFIRSEILQKAEIVAFIYSLINHRKFSVPVQYVFGPYMSYLSYGFSLTYNEDAPIEKREEKNKIAADIMKKITLLDMIEMAGRFDHWKKRDYSSFFQAELKNIWDETKGEKNKIRENEENYVTKTKILPTIFQINSTLTKEQLKELMELINAFQTDKKGRRISSILKQMPSLRNEVEVMSTAVLDKNRKYNMNDFFDLENIIIPLAYSNVFVSQDRWIRHLLKVTDLPKKNGCKYFYDFKELTTYLTNGYLT